jgi:hypothetical protein
MPALRHLSAIALVFLLARVGPAAAADTAAWGYGPGLWSEAQWEAKLAALPPGIRLLYASLEEGGQYLLDNDFRAADIQRSVEALRERFNVTVHALILQDTRWLDDPEGALRRVTRMLELNRLRPEQAFAGVHVSIEPHSLEEWECGGAPERRRLVQKLQGLLARIVAAIPTEPPAKRKKDVQSRIHFSAALPWWMGSLSTDLPEASVPRWLETLDEVVLMAYGEPGGPRVGGSSRALLQRLEDARLWQGIPAGKGIRIGLATYEYANAAEIQAVSRELDKALGGRASYRGTAIFHLTSRYGVPLAASVRGLVRDAGGQPVAQARIRIGDRETATSRCGRFEFRGLPSPPGELQVGGIGLQSVTVPLADVKPGQELEIPPIVVNRSQ